MTLLQNTFVKAIVIPIVLAMAAGLLESTSALAKGVSKGPYKYRIWIRQRRPDNTTTVVPLLGQSIHMVLTQQNEIVAIDLMVSFDIGEFGSLGVDLIVGAFAIDIVSLISGQSNPTVTGWVLVVHLLMLIGIVSFIMLSHLATPEEQSYKRSRAAAAIGLGLFAMIVAFAAI